MEQVQRVNCELTVVGMGIAGLAAALFAANRKIDTVLVGSTGEILFASGLLDLLGVHPLETAKVWENPWDGLKEMIRDIPQHPYARVSNAQIQQAFEEFVQFLDQSQLHYRIDPRGLNTSIPTSVGTLKTSYAIPLTMWHGAVAWRERQPCLFVDIQGLKTFSARQIVETLTPRWPDVRAAKITFPGTASRQELYPERMARSLELQSTREALAKVLQPHLPGISAIGMPGILGITQSGTVLKEMETLLGMPFFEIPSMPPTIPGLRLKEAFDNQLPVQGVKVFSENRVMHTSLRPDGIFTLHVGRKEPELEITSQAVLLATGRFIGGGLQASRTGIKETLFDLPVHSPTRRSNWHHADFLDPRGHPLNSCGLQTDHYLRPLNRSGQPAHEKLYCAGSILAHQDWIRMKCGAGLALATALAAVESYQQMVS